VNRMDCEWHDPSRPSNGSKVLHVCAGAYSRDLASTRVQLESGIGPALVCASVPFGDLKCDISATNVCEWRGL
jgi:hypothetical protein